jgi:hypothetical protein
MQPGTAPLGVILMRGDTRPALDPYDFSLWQRNLLTFQIQNANNDYVSVTYTVPFNTWTHAAGTLDDSTGDMKLYVNGVLVASTNTSIRPFAVLDPSSSPGLGIGCDQTGQYGEYFHGWLDEVRISNTALDPSQFLIHPTCVPHRATAVATLVNGFVVGATVTDGGCGYTNTPVVVIQGGGGSGAQATAVVSNGVVTGITITDAGVGYTSYPTIYIYSPIGVQIGLVKAVKPTFSDLVPGANYQLQISSDMNNWTNQGSPFTAAGATMVYPQYWDVDNWNKLFFRVQLLP